MAATDARGAARWGLVGRLLRALGAFGGVLAAGHAEAVDLSEDRADLMYHSYIGGGVVANGPALLVHKSIGDEFSVSGSYYVDTVSNASIDVVTTASPYHEQRVETGVGAEYVHRETLISAGATESREPDYVADSASLDVSQDMFGGMTTVKLGYTRGWDTVGKHDDPQFSEPAEHWQYRLGMTQILTPRWLASLNVEAISDTGYLASPYRVARVYGAAVPEVDPPTRTSRAATLGAVGAVGEQGAVRATVRYFWDTWAIHADTMEVGYAFHANPRWLLDANLRYYTQNHALFYADDFTTAMTYMSRNRELSTFHDVAAGMKATYTAYRIPARLELRLNGSVELMQFHYDDFTDLRPGHYGQLYAFHATVMELFVSATF